MDTLLIGILLTVFVGVLGFMFKRLYDKLDELDNTLTELNVNMGKLEEHKNYVDSRFKEHERRFEQLEKR